MWNAHGAPGAHKDVKELVRVVDAQGACHVKQQLLNMASAIILCTLPKTEGEGAYQSGTRSGPPTSTARWSRVGTHHSWQPVLDAARLLRLPRSWFDRLLVANFHGSLNAFGFDWSGMQARRLFQRITPPNHTPNHTRKIIPHTQTLNPFIYVCALYFSKSGCVGVF